MILDKKNRTVLAEKGIIIIEGKDLLLYKPFGKAGNAIPNWKGTALISFSQDGETAEEIYSDCPMLRLEKTAEKYILIHWDWVPGPGPGDFRLEFETEIAVLDFIESYFFGNNQYFEARKNYERLSRDSINLVEINSIFKAVSVALEQKFERKEIYFDRHFFHKLPLENFRSKDFESEQPKVQVELGFLSDQIRRLRTKLFEQQDFTADDIREVADLLMELSLIMKK